MKPRFLFFLGAGWCATHPMWRTIKDHVETGVTRELHYPYSCPDSVEGYVNYYKSLNSFLVGDFSNTNYYLSDEVFDRYITALQKEFDVFFILITRDPVRRCWSEFGFNYFQSKDLQEEFETVDLYMTQYCLWWKSYTDTIERAQKYAPCHVFVSEEMWRDTMQKDLRRMESILGLKYGTLKSWHPNVYFPERGIRPIKHVDLPDQYNSDTVELTHRRYGVYQKLLKPHYKSWERMFGSLPYSWRKRIDYEYNQSLPIDIGEEYLLPGSYIERDGKLFIPKV